jgi:hypothetical protein
MRRTHPYASALLVTAALMVGGFIAPAVCSQETHVRTQDKSQDQSEVKEFKGKILSQNGQRFILRDDANGVWYNLDDQQQAGKFLGKNVSVTGVLDEPTLTIHVRSITDANP